MAPLLALCALMATQVIASPPHTLMPSTDIFAADHLLQEGRVDEAANLLRATLIHDPNNFFANQLLCRVFYAQDDADSAIHLCELAVASSDADNEQASDNYLWLGRAYGLKARRAGPISGLMLARKVVSSFSRAVELNPNSIAAINDLGEYYVSAPFIVGGGTDKAHALADRTMTRFPGAAHRMLARIAASENNLTTAESEFKQAIAADRTSGAWIDLAQFYQTHSRPDDALAAVKSALAAERNHGPALVDAASILTRAGRAPDLAVQCLRDYLSSSAKSDAAPAFKAHLQLARLLAARGDTSAADREVAAATTLAATYTRSERSDHGL
jgi:tetratricopeptide (TPR) repeat protein